MPLYAFSVLSSKPHTIGGVGCNSMRGTELPLAALNVLSEVAPGLPGAVAGAFGLRSETVPSICVRPLGFEKKLNSLPDRTIRLLPGLNAETIELRFEAGSARNDPPRLRRGVSTEVEEGEATRDTVGALMEGGGAGEALIGRAAASVGGDEGMTRPATGATPRMEPAGDGDEDGDCEWVADGTPEWLAEGAADGIAE